MPAKTGYCHCESSFTILIVFNQRSLSHPTWVISLITDEDTWLHVTPGGQDPGSDHTFGISLSQTCTEPEGGLAPGNEHSQYPLCSVVQLQAGTRLCCLQTVLS